MQVVDFRARPNTPEYMELYSKSWEEHPMRQSTLRGTYGYVPDPEESYPGVGSLDEFIELLDEHGIDVGVFTGRQRVTDDGEVTVGVSNDYVAECVDRFPDRLVGFAGVDGSRPVPAVTAEIDRAIGELGLSGISLYQFVTGRPDDSHFYPIYERAAEFDVPVVFTVGPNVQAQDAVGRAHDPYPIDTVAADFPDVTFVCAHAAWPRTDEFVALAYRRQNVYLEGSIYQFFPGTEVFWDAAENLIPDKIMYASAFPWGPIDQIDVLQEEVDLSEETKRKVLFENAAGILGLD